MDNELKEMLNSIIKRMEVIELKLDRNTEKIDDLGLDLKIVERNVRKDIRKLTDENETIIEVLKIHDILPR